MGLNTPTPNRKDVHSMFHMLSAVQSAIADLLVNNNNKHEDDDNNNNNKSSSGDEIPKHDVTYHLIFLLGLQFD